MDIEVKAKKIRTKLEKFSLPTIKLFPKVELAENIYSSKFGGKPYWPKCLKYPESKSGEKLVLLAQLNFNELPRLTDFPQDGILQFFVENDDLYGMDFDISFEDVMKSPSGYRVIYHPVLERNEELLENNLPEANKESYLPISREYRLKSTLDSEIPSHTDFRYEKYSSAPFEYEDELSDYIYDNFVSEGSKIGGYANFAQEDPRVNGEHDNWVLLFQMDSEYLGDNDIMWGDVGVGNFFIEKEALKKNDFSRVWYNWDCC
ncbi:DUF1963 domain-containing protein [Photobacterium kishitanii]|uniref:YwqG family protein n=1 Tax=Photobacterium kishitanii TaxID=318456 RepID=UPI000D179374|nr:YwqG family protein [Photobacterium kishitanii]PSU92023.1 DUF1963 domain-containing protein [Photobacterium kishitanii]